MRSKQRACVLGAIGLGLACAAAHAGSPVNVDPTKIGGDYISGSGIPADNFLSDTNGDVSVFLKIRGRDSGQALAINGNTFVVRDGVAASNAGASWWSFDFQFTPNAADAVDGQNYILTLDFDTDPTTGVSFLTFSNPIFDAVPDADPLNSWDDTDGFFVNGAPVFSDGAIDYVFSQSWRPNFGFLYGSVPPPGEYTIRWSVRDANDPSGDALASVTAIAQVIPASLPALSLDAVEDCLDASDDTLVVEVNLSNAASDIVGGQFFLSYDNTKLSFTSADPGDAPFSEELLESVNTGAGEISYIVNIPIAGTGTADPTTMARFTFEFLSEVCSVEDLVAWRTNIPPSRITQAGGANIEPTLLDLGLVTNDNTAPVISAPDDIVTNADAGLCGSATLSYVEEFNTAVPLCASQTPDCWYVDRYAPAAFEMAYFDGDNRLHHGISSADSAANRPPSFSSTFYNTQGRKHDVDIPVGRTFAIDLYVPADWETNVRRADLWGTCYDSSNAISAYPIIGFSSNDPADELNPSPASPTPRFRVWDNAGAGGWIDLGLPVGFSYNSWWTLEIETTTTQFIYRVIDDTDTVVLAIALDALGSVRTGNIIIQAYNFGETYDVYWDNLIMGPEGPVATDNCSAVSISYVRSDNASLTLEDPFPAGTTMVTWTATDACGNSASDIQMVTVNGGVNTLHVALELQATVDSGPFDRCITFELDPVGAGPLVLHSEVFTFTNGMASGAIDIPCGDYECITAQDTLHTLRMTDNDDFGIFGSDYFADFTTSGDGDALPGGNLNDDDYIDILDFGVFIGQYGAVLDPDTTCATAAPHSDITGDGDVGTGDFTFIQINILDFNELRCDGSLLGAPAYAHGAAGLQPLEENGRGPVMSITIAELEMLGMGKLAVADLNDDGLLDQGDMVAFMLGARPDHAADLNGDGAIDRRDLAIVLRAVLSGDLAGDIDDNGVVDQDDVTFVASRIAAPAR